MIRFFTVFICLCFFSSGCSFLVQVPESDEPVEVWLASHEAEKGYIYLSGDMTHRVSTSRKINLLNNDDKIDRILIIIGTISASRTSLDKMVDDVIKGIAASKKPEEVIATGTCYGHCIAIYAAATGKRYAFPDTNFVMHNSKSAGDKGSIEKVLQVEADKYDSVFREKADLPEEWFPLEEEWIFFTEKEAREYKLVDEVITKMP
jgi:ATP-dependent protease ClpP protease subunit